MLYLNLILNNDSARGKRVRKLCDDTVQDMVSPTTSCENTQEVQVNETVNSSAQVTGIVQLFLEVKFKPLAN